MKLAIGLLLGSLAFAPQAAAQDKPVQQHRGLWGGFGLGGGVNLTQTFDEGSLWGVSGYGRIGGTLNQRVLLGAESSGWYGSSNGVDFSRGNLSGILLFYPSPRGGLYLKGGVGFGYVVTAINESYTVNGIYYSTSVSQTKGGFGATAGVGFDVRLGRNIYLVPAVDWYLQAVGSADSGVFGSTPGTNNIIAFSLGLVWH